MDALKFPCIGAFFLFGMSYGIYEVITKKAYTRGGLRVGKQAIILGWTKIVIFLSLFILVALGFYHFELGNP